MPNTAPPPHVDAPFGYRELAALAETADGMGGNLILALVPGENGKKTVAVETKQEADAKGHTIILEGITVTTNQFKARIWADEIFIRIPQTGELMACKIDDIDCDAVFRSESAIRKFLIPYYEAQRLLDPDQMKKLNDLVDDPSVVAIAHVYPSHYGALGADTGVRVLLTQGAKKGVIGPLWVSLDDYSGKS